jgi:predicted glycogen debranching enzyme
MYRSKRALLLPHDLPHSFFALFVNELNDIDVVEQLAGKDKHTIAAFQRALRRDGLETKLTFGLLNFQKRSFSQAQRAAEFLGEFNPSELIDCDMHTFLRVDYSPGMEDTETSRDRRTAFLRNDRIHSPHMPLYSIQTHGELHPFVQFEWLLTNGMGAFAMSSVVGCNTRRYHGLLNAATKPPVGRMMTLNRVGELVHLDNKAEFNELSVNQFRSSFHPRGDKFLRKFELDRVIRWEYDVEGVSISKELLLVWKKNLIGLRYQVHAAAGRAVELKLLPFVSMRDFHALRQASTANFQVDCDAWKLSVREGEHVLHLRTEAGQFERRSDWWYGHTYQIETERGQDDTEDLYVPGILSHKMTGGGTLTLWAGLDKDGQEMIEWEPEARERPEAMGLPGKEPTPVMRRLFHAANDFVVERKRPDGRPGTTIIAGYPWFADWGRDTMISLPGLLLSTGRFEEAAQVLSVFAEYVSEGMIPNRFDDYTNEPSYNTVDASLWFINACFEYVRASGDNKTFEEVLLKACREIIRGYSQGTRFHIKMDEKDGLISSGDASTQLTWMDAKHEGIAYTPRQGKAVEINALWYNALVLLGEKERAGQVKESFVRAFWLNPFRGLADVVDENHKDISVRPNQIFAASLPNSPLSLDQQAAVVEVVRRELLTPYGLRTLARNDPKYCGRYCGPRDQRDGAYHNGTVWSWLMGGFLEAYLRVHGRSLNAVRQCRVWLQPLVDHMNQACVGQISECFDGDEPHRPVAAPAQAWSVAETLRLAALLEM